MTLHLDFETRSTIDLRKTGVHVYAEDTTTDAWCMAYAFGDGPVKLWKMGDPLPPEIEAYIRFDDGELVAHNAAFERAIWRHIMHERYGWPDVPLERWRCTMAQAYAMSLPGALKDVAGALGVEISKDMAGHRLMMKMAKPRTYQGTGAIIWWDKGNPDLLPRLYDYCKQDVEVERAIDKRLLKLRPSEQRVWVLDQKINDRGVFVDKELCNQSKKVVAQAKKMLDAEMAQVTDYAVTACSNRNQVAAYLKYAGVETDSIAKDKIAELLARDDLTPDVRRVLELRREGAKASVAKITSMLQGRSFDGRARGLFQYHGAGTGRWAGRRIQLQNMKRPAKGTDVDMAVEALMTGNLDIVMLMFDDPMSVIGDCLRGMLCAEDGNKLVAADYANIEGRVLAWLAGETWKLKAFEEYDAGDGHDLYKLAYHRTFGTPVDEVDDTQRQVGKVEELALGYQGGHGAFITMGATYGVDADEMVPIVRGQVDEDTWDGFAAMFDPGPGLKKPTWTALKIIIDGWRRGHPAITTFWRDLEDAARQAVENPGQAVTCGPVTYRVAGSFLWCRLPSDRALCYPYPKMAWKTMPWKDKDGKPVKKLVVSYKGVDTYTRKWSDQYTYGGKLAENITQAVARDVLAEAMLRLDDAGYPTALHVHDEVVAEVPADFGSVEEFCGIMAEKPSWLEGCPIAVEGWQGARYRK